MGDIEDMRAEARRLLAGDPSGLAAMERDDLAREHGPRTAETARCAYCGVTGPAQLFEPFNTIPGNLACRAGAACELRQQGVDPVHQLGVLLRAVRKELGALTGDELVNLAVDLTGYQDAVTRLLIRAGKDGPAVEAERRDREARAARRPGG